jgi:TRAP-type C4-dicarboxylate transport system permease small subunit
MIISKLSRYVLWAIMVVSLVLIGFFFFGGFVENTEGTSLAEPLITETILRWAYILLIITLALAVVFQLLSMFSSVKALKRAGIVLGIAAVFIFISYQLADDTILNLIQYSGPDNVPTTLKWVGTGLIFTYILGILAILSILYTAIANIFR